MTDYTLPARDPVDTDLARHYSREEAAERRWDQAAEQAKRLLRDDSRHDDALLDGWFNDDKFYAALLTFFRTDEKSLLDAATALRKVMDREADDYADRFPYRITKE